MTDVRRRSVQHVAPACTVLARAAVVVCCGSLLAVAGCGGGADASTPASAASAASPGATETPSTWPPTGSKDELATYPYKYGVSWKAPRDWSFEKDPGTSEGYESYTWTKGKKGKQGLVFVTVQNSRSTVAEWRAIVVKGYAGRAKTLDEPVDVPGYGKGVHLRYTDPKHKNRTDVLIVTSIDGVLLEMDVSTPPAGDPTLTAQVVSSVKRST